MISVVMLTMSVMSQSVEDAGAKYNEGNEYYKEKNYKVAITSYEAALKIANKVGADAADLKGSIEKQLLNTVYAIGKEQYKAKKFDAAIASFEKSYAMSEQLGDESKKQSSTSFIAKVRTSKGGSLLKKNKVDEAFAEYTMAIELLPTYVNAYYGLVLVYNNQDDMANMIVNADKVIEYGAAKKKAAKIIKKTKSTASKALVNAGAKEIQKDQSKKAIELIESSFNYAPGNSTTYYYLSLAYGKAKNWDKSIEAANMAISLETEKDKSDMYFALGQAYEGNGSGGDACVAYKNVTGGPNVEAAKYQMTQVLKCN